MHICTKFMSIFTIHQMWNQCTTIPLLCLVDSQLYCAVYLILFRMGLFFLFFCFPFRLKTNCLPPRRIMHCFLLCIVYHTRHNKMVFTFFIFMYKVKRFLFRRKHWPVHMDSKRPAMQKKLQKGNCRHLSTNVVYRMNVLFSFKFEYKTCSMKIFCNFHQVWLQKNFGKFPFWCIGWFSSKLVEFLCSAHIINEILTWKLYTDAISVNRYFRNIGILAKCNKTFFISFL